jgi:hypothetical protein
VQPIEIEEAACRFVGDQGAVFPTVPERLDHSGEFAGSFVAVRMPDDSIETKIFGYNGVDC